MPAEMTTVAWGCETPASPSLNAKPPVASLLMKTHGGPFRAAAAEPHTRLGALTPTWEALVSRPIRGLSRDGVRCLFGA
jgi:hypothetical protein